MTGLDDLAQEHAAAQPAVASMVGEEWFGSQANGRTMLMAVPLSPEMMIAALFTAGQFVVAEDLADDTEAWGFIGQALVREGTDFLEGLVQRLPEMEKAGLLPEARGQDGAGWLEFCRYRVGLLTARSPR